MVLNNMDYLIINMAESNVRKITGFFEHVRFFSGEF